MTTTASVVTLEQTVRLLASTDAELLGAQPKPELYGPLAFALVEFMALLSAPRAGTFESVFRLWRIYKDAKKRLQKGTGWGIARTVSAFGGAGICDRIEYCRNKAKLKELFDFADSPEGKAAFAKGVDAAIDSKYKETIEKLQEMLGKAAEVIGEATKEVAEEVADNAVPISFVFMSIKYGFDDLCKCCEACDGLGFVVGKECVKCSGKGHTRP